MKTNFEEIEEMSLRISRKDVTSRDVVFPYVDMCNALIEFYLTKSIGRDRVTQLVNRNKIKVIKSHRSVFKKFLNIKGEMSK